jgi:hypothetical protein
MHNSGHFYYDENDVAVLREEFAKFVSEEVEADVG